MLTARRETEDVRKAIGMGAFGYLVKPFDDKQLLERVARMVAPPPARNRAPAGEPLWEL